MAVDYNPTPESGLPVTGRDFARQTREFINDADNAANSAGANAETAITMAASATLKAEQVQGDLEEHAALTENLHGATAEAAPYRLVTRDAGGNARIADPVVRGDMANKGYVDDGDGQLSGEINTISSRMDTVEQKVGNVQDQLQMATSDRFGITKFATGAELDEGNPHRAVSAFHLKDVYEAINGVVSDGVPEATEELKGISRIANTKEVEMGMSDGSVLTPLKTRVAIESNEWVSRATCIKTVKRNPRRGVSWGFTRLETDYPFYHCFSGGGYNYALAGDTLHMTRDFSSWRVTKMTQPGVWTGAACSRDGRFIYMIENNMNMQFSRDYGQTFNQVQANGFDFSYADIVYGHGMFVCAIYEDDQLYTLRDLEYPYPNLDPVTMVELSELPDYGGLSFVNGYFMACQQAGGQLGTTMFNDYLGDGYQGHDTLSSTVWPTRTIYVNGIYYRLGSRPEISPTVYMYTDRQDPEELVRVASWERKPMPVAGLNRLQWLDGMFVAATNEKIYMGTSLDSLVSESVGNATLATDLCASEDLIYFVDITGTMYSAYTAAQYERLPNHYWFSQVTNEHRFPNGLVATTEPRPFSLVLRDVEGNIPTGVRGAAAAMSLFAEEEANLWAYTDDIDAAGIKNGVYFTRDETAGTFPAENRAGVLLNLATPEGGGWQLFFNAATGCLAMRARDNTESPWGSWNSTALHRG